MDFYRGTKMENFTAEMIYQLLSFPPFYQSWWENGVRHRNGDKPAIIGDGYLAWWVHGEQHRSNHLPAVIHDNGILEYWEDDKEIYVDHQKHILP